MGLSLDCFSTEPSSDYYCGVCKDIAEDAVDFGVCGHIFSETCAIGVLHLCRPPSVQYSYFTTLL